MGCTVVITAVQYEITAYNSPNTLFSHHECSQAFNIVLSSSNLVQRVRHNTERFRNAMIKAGFRIAGKGHPICPVMLSQERLASAFADEMLGESQAHSYKSSSQYLNSDRFAFITKYF
jgi:7-keto-8-aminopelargonate synthetase-like enzyme